MEETDICSKINRIRAIVKISYGMMEIRKKVVNSLGWSWKASWRRWLMTKLILMGWSRRESAWTQVRKRCFLSDFKHTSTVSLSHCKNKNWWSKKKRQIGIWKHQWRSLVRVGWKVLKASCVGLSAESTWLMSFPFPAPLPSYVLIGYGFQEEICCAFSERHFGNTKPVTSKE